jgi:hypothetical protein
MTPLLFALALAQPRAYAGPAQVVAVAAPDDAPSGDAPPVETEAAKPVAPVSDDTADDSSMLAPEAGPWVLGGFVDTAYQGSTNQPDNHDWRGMFSSPRTNEITLNLVGLYVRRDAAPRDPFHLELAINAGAAADALFVAEPTPGGENSRFAGPETWKHLGRANAGLAFDSGTDVTAGLMVCPIGLGIFWTPSNWHYTTPWSLNGVPYYLAGGRVTQNIGDKVQLQAWVVNGWQTLGDINKVPSYMTGIVITPRRDLSIQEMFYFGAEDVDPNPRSWRTFWNTQLAWNTEKVGVMALVDVGRERLTFLPGAPVALWVATDVDVRWRVLGRKHTWDMATRGGAYWDRDGRMFGVPTWLLSAVYTNDVRLFEHVLLRLEYRYDRATADGGFFYRHAATADDSPGLARDQHTIVAALTGYFEIGLPKVRARRKK